MSTGYKIDFPDKPYFLTFTVVEWVDIFSRKAYRDILMESMDFCRQKKGIKNWGYTIMTNHMHCIWQSTDGLLPETIRDFKRHTSQSILKIMPSVNESRMDWMLKRFEFAAMSGARNSKYQFWENTNHAEVIMTENFFLQKLNYIHNNPVKAGWVEHPQDWLYSSARNYMGLKGLIDIDVSGE